MPDSAGGKVFISYARIDGAKLAQRLQGDLRDKGYNAWLDTQRLRGGASWTNEIETALDEAEFVLVLMTPGSYVSEICRAEQLRSLRRRTCVIPLKAHPKTEIPLHLETKEYCDFTTHRTYAEAFAKLLDDIHASVGITLDDTRPVKGGTSEEKFRESFRDTYVTAPPLPMNFVDRPEALTALRGALITDGSGRHIALTALEGMGGIGKTVLAKVSVGVWNRESGDRVKGCDGTRDDALALLHAGDVGHRLDLVLARPALWREQRVQPVSVGAAIGVRHDLTAPLVIGCVGDPPPDLVR